MKLELLSKLHDRKRFDCGVEPLDRFLRETARQHMDKGISRTWVAVEDQHPEQIRGYFTLAICEVLTGTLPPDLMRRLPPKAGAIRLGRLAVDRDFQGLGLGGALLIQAIRMASIAANSLGGIGLFVDAKDERAAAFYIRFGFHRLQPEDLVLFLPLSDLLATLQE